MDVDTNFQVSNSNSQKNSLRVHSKMIKRNHVSKSKLNMLLTCDVSIDLFNCSQVKIESKAQLSYQQWPVKGLEQVTIYDSNNSIFAAVQHIQSRGTIKLGTYIFFGKDFELTYYHYKCGTTCDKI